MCKRQRSVRQLLAMLLSYEVGSVPVRPIRIMAAASLFVLAMCGGGAAQCSGKIGS
jgi:hypothetical protein